MLASTCGGTNRQRCGMTGPPVRLCGNGTFLAVKEKKFDRRVEKVTGWAPDHDAVERAVSRIHDELALDFGGTTTTRAGIGIQIGGTVEKYHRAAHIYFAFPPCSGLAGISTPAAITRAGLPVPQAPGVRRFLRAPPTAAGGLQAMWRRCGVRQSQRTVWRAALPAGVLEPGSAL